MKKYWLVAKNTWDETVTYRFNFVMWRVRTILQLLTVYFLWLAVIPKDGSFGTYSQSLMLTYIFGTQILFSFVFASRSYNVGDEINLGNLSNFLIRPINYFAYWFAKDLGDKAMNIVFATGELTLLFLILKPPLFIQKELPFILFFILAVILAIFMYFFFNFLLGLIAFWSPEVWAPRFIFYVLINFVSGGLFPLDVLPSAIFEKLIFLPFTYMLYFPLKIYLGQLSTSQILSGMAIASVWTIVFYLIVKLVWQAGLKVYTSQGR